MSSFGLWLFTNFVQQKSHNSIPFLHFSSSYCIFGDFLEQKNIEETFLYVAVKRVNVYKFYKQDFGRMYKSKTHLRPLFILLVRKLILKKLKYVKILI